jgi:N-acyl-D-aspartate/D-glutamate deacylase
VYCPHWKKTGRREGITAGARQPEPIQGILDAIKVHKETGVRLHFAHIRSGWNINPSPPEDFSEFNAKKTIQTIVDKSKTDLDITWDAIPSMVKGGFTWIGPYLISLLEPWLRVFGSREILAEWLHSSDLREEIKEVVFSGKWGWVIYCNPNFNPKWAESIFIIKSKNKNIENKTLAEIAGERDNDTIETMFDLLEEDPETMMYPDTLGGAAKTYKLNPFLQHSRGSIGLDTWAIDDKYMAPNPPYTRRGIISYNAFPLFYKKYVVDEKQLTLDQAVQKTSKSAADAHNLTGRGTINMGNYADLVLMDLNKLEITATPVEPRKYAIGIEHVLINGVPVIEKGIHTGKRSGQIIKNPNTTKK